MTTTNTNTNTDTTFDWLTAALPTGRSLISVGCSTADEADALTAAGWDVLGIDNDGPTIAAARDAHPHATFLTRDAAYFTPDAPVDVVLVRRPNLVEQSAQWREILSSAARWLTPTGTLVLTTPAHPEAAVARRMLIAAGFEPSSSETGVPDEAVLVRAHAPVRIPTRPALPRPALANVVVLDLDDEPAPFCDPTTGICS